MGERRKEGGRRVERKEKRVTFGVSLRMSFWELTFWEEPDLCGFMFQGLKLVPTDVLLTRLWLQHDLHWLPYY